LYDKMCVAHTALVAFVTAKGVWVKEDLELLKEECSSLNSSRYHTEGSWSHIGDACDTSSGQSSALEIDSSGNCQGYLT
jgi:hypothetical protein